MVRSRTMIKKSRARLVFEIFNYIFLLLLVLTTAYPFLNQLSISLSTTKYAYAPGLHIFPNLKGLTLDSYKLIFKSSSLVFGFFNSIIRAALGTAFSLLVYGLTAYPLSKRNLPGVKILTWIFVFTMLFDGGIIPNYILIQKLGLMNKRFALIVQGVVSAFNIIIMRNFFFGIPESLEESAKLEGAGDITIYFRIIVPLSKPVMATIGLWVAVWHWNNWFDALIYITDRSKQVLQIILREILINNTGDMMNEMRMMQNLDFQMLQLRAAVIIVSVVPVVLIYPLIQKYFIKGIMLGSIKG